MFVCALGQKKKKQNQKTQTQNLGIGRSYVKKKKKVFSTDCSHKHLQSSAVSKMFMLHLG